jgi:anti-anti-sigma regulatory factor
VPAARHLPPYRHQKQSILPQVQSFDAKRLAQHVLHSCRQPMMKIQVNDVGDRLILEVEGRLAGVFVPELEHCWRSALATRPDKMVLVDLKHVTCVDRAGRSLLQSMHCGGVLFLRAGIAIQDILEQIIEEQECKQH